MGSVKGLFLGPKSIIGSLPDWGGLARSALEGVLVAFGVSGCVLPDASDLTIGVGFNLGSGFSWAKACEKRPSNRLLRRQNFLNMVLLNRL